MSQPDYKQIVDLAIRLGKHEYVDPGWILHPQWASCPPEYKPMLNIAARLREWAALILAGKVPMPEWLKDASAPEPAAPEPAPAPNPHVEAISLIREYPMAAAHVLLSSVPVLPRRTPSPWPPPRRRKTAPVRLHDPPWHESRYPVPVAFFDNKRVVAPAARQPAWRCRVSRRAFACEALFGNALSGLG